MLLGEVGLTLGTEKPTGKSEVTNLHDVDVAVTNKIAMLINELTVSIPNDLPASRAKPLKSLRKFLARDISQQIGYGVFDTPKAFLGAFVRANKSKNEKGKAKNKIDLPLVYVSRDPSIFFTDTEKDIPNAQTLTTSEGEKIGTLDFYSVDLNYQINIIAWSKDEAATMALHVLTWLRSYDRSQDKRFTAKTVLADAEEMELGWSFKDVQTLSADNATLPFDEGRLYCLSIAVSVQSEVASVRYVEVGRAPLVARGHNVSG